MTHNKFKLVATILVVGAGGAIINGVDHPALVLLVEVGAFVLLMAGLRKLIYALGWPQQQQQPRAQQRHVEHAAFSPALTARLKAEAAGISAAQVREEQLLDARVFFAQFPPGVRLSDDNKRLAQHHTEICPEVAAEFVAKAGLLVTDARTGAATGNEGFVYVLSNPAMPGILKIGKTSRPVAERVAELSGATGVALPFRVEFALRCDDHHAAERAAHLRLTAFRVNNGREFFKCDVQAAIATITAVLGGSAVLA